MVCHLCSRNADSYRLRVVVDPLLLLAAHQIPRQVTVGSCRLRQMDDNEPEKQDNMKYLGEDFRYRWIMFGLILLSITGMWVHFDWTRAALFYSGCLWGLCFVFRSFLLKKLEKFKAYMFELPTNKE